MGKIFYIISVVLMCSIFSLGAGFVITYQKWFPSEHLLKMYIAGSSLYRFLADPIQTRYKPSRFSDSGVTVYKQDKAFDGYTLYTSSHGTEAFLINMYGKLVHKWSLPFSEIAKRNSDVYRVIGDKQTYWFRAHLFPNFDLLALYHGEPATPNGLGVARMDKDSKLIWSYGENVHHDLDIAPDGSIYLLGQHIRNSEMAGFPKARTPFLDETIIVLSPSGKEIKRINILASIRDSNFRSLGNLLSYQNISGDYMHNNTVKVVTENIARRFPFATEGNILLSLRHAHVIALLDPDQLEIVWAIRGFWVSQHDPDFLDNGNMLIFDNQGHLGPGGRSRVIEFDPTTMEAIWSYEGTAEQPLYSALKSNQQRLPNGNTLIVEAEAGRILEVTPAGEIVWEFLNPHQREQGGRTFIANITHATRLARDEVPFLSTD